MLFGIHQMVKRQVKNGRSNCWMIGNKTKLGSDIGVIKSTDDANGPHEASSWNYKKDGEWIETTDCILLSASGIFNTSICG